MVIGGETVNIELNENIQGYKDFGFNKDYGQGDKRQGNNLV